MWAFFSRKAHRDAHRRGPGQRRATVADTETPAWTPNTHNPIATIDRIGPTAVATLTVTALATGEGVARLMGLFEDVNQSGARHFVLDVQNLEYMDSACLGCLVKALNHAADDGGRIALANADAAIQDLFRVTHLDRRFRLCHDVPAALEAVERP